MRLSQSQSYGSWYTIEILKRTRSAPTDYAHLVKWAVSDVICSTRSHNWCVILRCNKELKIFLRAISIVISRTNKKYIYFRVLNKLLFWQIQKGKEIKYLIWFD